MAKPDFRKVWNAFPDHVQYPSLRDLYTHLGGLAERNINAPGFGPAGNTCASRISVALNKGGSPIDRAVATRARARSTAAADGSRIIFAVADLSRYLHAVLGAPVEDKALPYDDAFRGRKGIVAFGISGWNDATGHIALFDGATYREPGHDDYASFARGGAKTFLGQFWELN